MISVELRQPRASMLGVTVERTSAERFWGFGVRSDAVDRIDGVVENWVGEGPYQLDEYPMVEAITPRWAIRRRRDAAYFPIPWLLSSDGYGVLIDNAQLSRFRFGPTDWSLEVLADDLRLRFFAGPTPADALRRFSQAVGRQPYPAAAWFLGPWCQTGHSDLVPIDVEEAIIATLCEADAPISAVETHMRRLPAGAHEDLRAEERARAQLFGEFGVASLTYLNPFVSEDYERRFAAAAPSLQRRADGTPYLFSAYAGGREPPIAVEGQLDFSSEGAAAFFGERAREAIEDGHDGWMEDFGEYTPVDSVASDGVTGERGHNLYPVQYHAAAAQAARSAGGRRAIARFGRSGWTGAARHLPLVWGGDPTTAWGFDGLESAVVQALSAGLSGIGFFGSDIGGFFSLGEQRLDTELLVRWIQFGAMSGLMRTKSEGVAVPAQARPQIWDADVLPHWRRWAKLHTQLSPYLLGAAAEYVETGLPSMRHWCLVDPADAAAMRSDQYLLGPSLLVAPVLRAGERQRSVTVPAGQWIDLWRSVEYDPAGGGLEMHAKRAAAGGGEVALPAPLEEIPVLVRAGAVIPMLAPDVWSLAAANDDPRLRLLAYPSGSSETRLWRDGRIWSIASRRDWLLEVAAGRDLEIQLQASLDFQPQHVKVTGGALESWTFNSTTGVLTATITGVQPVLRARA